MSFPKNIKMFLVSVTVLPQKEGIDLPRFIQKLANLLADYSTATRVLYKFKVSGESKILSVIQVFNIIGLERTIGGLWRLGAVDVDCQPIVSYENFARTIKVSEHLTKPNSSGLAKEGLYWLEFDVEYNGKSTDELITIWRKEAEAVLTARHKEGTSIELYKAVAQRKVHVFINAADPEQVDLLSLQLPIMQENGSNVQLKCKALQFLEDYTARITSDSI
ncbi:uncharacterized protein LOC106073787 isoform X1 [Biomphalaria glabrata]|uniref:Uncharacterized protein LOC106073787 isoform X1 n=2 Tax=Biomphalaria TaxID=6525 RepID=A0A9W2ZZZ1_BIOGL|nr:uncharacterized protein LOC106073787 isoform X1 [Biomphalaria glabrata]